MLTELSVRNVALIEEATLEFEPGLNAITGETGAGKTLLATALQLLLGGRARSESVRAGSEKATVEGTFVLPEDLLGRTLSEALGDLYDELDEGDLAEGLTLRRTLTGEGRSRCYVCGVSVPVKALAAIGDRLVSYHGQREQGKLTDPAEQLRILDDFLPERAREALKEHAALWREVERDRRELAEISSGAEARIRELDFLRYQVSEIQDSGYSAEEAAALARERERLRNVTDLLEAVGTATGALSGEEGGAMQGVGRARSELERAGGYDEGLSGLLERVGGIGAELEDVAYELRSYLDELEADPGRLDEIEGRLADFRELERKYGENVEGYLEEAGQRLSRLENAGEETEELERRISSGEQKLESLAAGITAGREEAAAALAGRVQENLADLKLGGTTFLAELAETGPGPSGRERVEFTIRPNPGEPLLPVRRYASGGELSRIMLAIRLAQESIEPGATYVFDEVDAGIGGETATAVGEKLKRLGGRNQVLTITHLPQIASGAGSQVVVAKEESAGRTITRILPVQGEERRRELARMLSGRVDDASLTHASDLLGEED
ncbi:DNA repair protein RecN [Rubrobacter aplysinae]|uniref:DNA repair protein RecN n=1 Tax=Rubrobacter aplysinae TaxID=909625 RepID=UPI00064C1356|nr:DNA repair protein RecN [Rubrobacter aplysinae]